MTPDKKVHPAVSIFAIITTVLLYMFFVSKYIGDETAPIAKVAPLYILVVTLLIITYLSVKNIQSRKGQIFLSLIILCVQVGLGLFLTAIWYRPRSDTVLTHQIWLTHLRILASLHYTWGFFVLFKSLFKTL